MVIFPLQPCEAVTFASHDDGSLFREEGGDGGLVRPLENGIMCSVRRIANIIEYDIEDKLLACSRRTRQRGGMHYE